MRRQFKTDTHHAINGSAMKIVQKRLKTVNMKSEKTIIVERERKREREKAN